MLRSCIRSPYGRRVWTGGLIPLFLTPAKAGLKEEFERLRERDEPIEERSENTNG